MLRLLLLLLYLQLLCPALSRPGSEKALAEYDETDEEGRRSMISSLLARVERIERTFNVSAFNPDMEEMSYLELFWEVLLRASCSNFFSYVMFRFMS